VKRQPASLEIDLTNGCPIRLNEARGTRVLCLHGIIWITSPGNRDDIFLEAGEAYRIERSGNSLVESIGNGSIRITAPPAGCLKNRIRQMLKRLTKRQEQPGQWSAS
jgi:hypothetical protein